MHFEAVVDKFPHDTILSFSTPLELNDNTISASLHSILRSASIKSSASSLHKPPLEEIIEDSREVDERVATATEGSTVKGNYQEAGTTPRQSLSRNTSVSSTRSRLLGSLSTGSKHYSVENNMQLAPVQNSEEKIVGTNRSAYESISDRPAPERRASSQSTRPSLRESMDSYSYHKKIKLGPRPSVDHGDSRSSRPPLYSHKSEPRQVSTLPASVRVPARYQVPVKASSQGLPHSVRSTSNATMTSLSQPEPLELDAYERPPSSGSVASAATHGKVCDSKQPTLSPEKQRLRKALQIRQRRLEMRPLKSPRLDESTHSPTLSSKLADEHVALDAINDGPIADVNYGLVHVFAQDMGDTSNANSENSPISTTEPSDGPSTQASSVADAEETEQNDVKTQFPIPETESSEKSTDLGLIIAPTERDPPSEPSSTNTVRNLEYVDLPLQSTSPSQIQIPVATLDESTELQQGPKLSQPCQDTQASSNVVNQSPTQSYTNTVQVDKEEKEVDFRTRPSSGDTVGSCESNRNGKKRAIVGPIKIVQTGETSDDNYLSDEAFMEELQSATVQEAKPMSVSRSPITPVFPKSPTKSTGNRSSAELSRTVSNHLAGSPQLRSRLTPDLNDKSPVMEKVETVGKFPLVTRVVSSPLRSTQQDSTTLSPPLNRSQNRRSVSVSPSRERERSESPMPLLKKVGVSSGISQRIKALEKISSTPESTSSSKHSTPNISPAFVSQRKTSITTPPSTTTSPPPQTGWNFRRRFPYPTPSPSPHATKSFPLKSSPPNATTTMLASKKPMVVEHGAPKKSQPDTISVTARIIRDTLNEKPEIPINPSEPAPLNLHQSPLVVEHKNAASESNLADDAPPAKKSSKLSRSPSVRSMSSSTSPDSRRDAAPPTLRRNSTNSRRSANSHKNSDAELSRPLSEASSNGTPSIDKPEDKKHSRTSRLFKRMSSIGTASRRSIVHALSPTVKEEDPIHEHAAANQVVEEEEETKGIDVGDVNVQFPDTLLWKRRHMELDGRGYLILERCKADDVIYARRFCNTKGS